MRLLNIDILTFQECYDNNIPPYFILSHRWSDNEVSFKDFSKRKNIDGARYRKIIEFCEFAKVSKTKLTTREEVEAIFQPRLVQRKRDIECAWVDTCCKFNKLSH